MHDRTANLTRALELSFNGVQIVTDSGQHLERAAVEGCHAGWLVRDGSNQALFRLTADGRAELMRRAPWYAGMKPFYSGAV